MSSLRQRIEGLSLDELNSAFAEEGQNLRTNIATSQVIFQRIQDTSDRMKVLVDRIIEVQAEVAEQVLQEQLANNESVMFNKGKGKGKGYGFGIWDPFHGGHWVPTTNSFGSKADGGGKGNKGPYGLTGPGVTVLQRPPRGRVPAPVVGNATNSIFNRMGD